MFSLDDSSRHALLIIARKSVVEAVQHGLETAPALLPESLRSPAGAFVTLWKHRRLRGCIGQLDAIDSLGLVVAHCAFGAALEDTRFSPVSPGELLELEIEISVLSPSFRIASSQIIAGDHGVVISRGRHRGVLLPKVAIEHGWTAERLLDETSIKAGLPREAWREPNTCIEAFTAEVFSESNPAHPSACAGA